MSNGANPMAVIKLILINVLVFVLLYGVTELSYSTYRYCLTDTSPDSFALFEHPGDTIRFDPIRGYFLTLTPSRVTRVNHGKADFVGSFRGNAQGFADRDDFTAQRSTASERRIAVFGDSFTSATMEPLNGPNWPDRVKDLCGASRGRPLALLNFAVDGGGLANWASILRNMVVKDGYDLDGLVFAVAWDDLDRKFAMFDQIDAQRFLHARASTWDVASQPKTRTEARALLEKDSNPAHRFVVSSAEFDAFLAGSWKPRQWKFRIWGRLAWLLARRTKTEKPNTGFEPGQMVLIKEIRQLSSDRSWKIAVVQIPTREELLESDADFRSNMEKSRAFAKMLGATFIDGREAFRGLTRQQIRADWFPVDGHWNGRGSDRFASYMAARLQSWLSAGAVSERSELKSLTAWR